MQRPRPLIVLGGQSPTILRAAAQRAEVWNTHGPPGIDLDQLVALTARQNHQLDELCAAHGREPSTLRRALTLFGAADPWTAPVEFVEVVDRFREVGIQDFVLHQPAERMRADLEKIALTLIPSRR